VKASRPPFSANAAILDGVSVERPELKVEIGDQIDHSAMV
jgi:hypothetical protein